MNPETAHLLVEDSRFWVIKPRVSLQGISGLGTIISGAYIQLRPGDSETSKRRFEVLEYVPRELRDVPGLSLQLTSPSDASLDVGDPILYQGRSVGQIDRVQFDTENQTMRYSVFVRSPYDQLVTRNTKFWKRSGIEVTMGSEGFQLRTGSLQSLMMGGIEFGIPEGIRPDTTVQDEQSLRLFKSKEAAFQDRFDKRIRYVALFNDSVQGLNEGSPVEFHGIRVGTVSDVPFLSSESKLELSREGQIPVLISFEPQRLNRTEEKLDLTSWRKRLRSLFQQGLHASIQPANLITGAMYVDLQFGDTSVPYTSRTVSDYPVFPSRSGGYTNIQGKVAKLLDKINELDVGKTLKRTRTMMENINTILGSETTRDLPNQLRSSLRSIDQTLESYQQGGAVHGKLKRSLERLNRVLKELEPLTETLRDKPNAVIFGRDAVPPDPVPRAAD